MNRTLEDVFSSRLSTPYHHDGRFAEERARYLHYLGERGWKRETLIGKHASWPPLPHVLTSTVRMA